MLDGELSPVEAEELKGHLSHCGACRQEWALQEKEHSWWESLPKEELPSARLWNHIAADLNRVAEPNQGLRKLWSFFDPRMVFSISRPLLVAGTMALVLSCGYLLTGYLGYFSSNDASAAILMEDYIQWRREKAESWRSVTRDGRSVEELKALNPFQETTPSGNENNPFTIG